MEDEKLTTKEALELIDLLKNICEKENLVLPNHGQKSEFYVEADENKKQFIVNINHCNRNINKYTFQSRTALNHIPLLRLDINPNGVHMNPDGKKIYGTHLHIYNQDFGLDEAIKFDINEPNLYNHCLAFFKKFNILHNNCDIIYQEEF